MSQILEESVLHEWMGLLVRFVELAAGLVIFSGAAVGFLLFARALLSRVPGRDFSRIRLTVARFLALGLEFQLASDLLRTAVAPTWEQIGKLAAVAAIRTALNFFLSREMEVERGEVEQEARIGGGAPRSQPGGPRPSVAPPSGSGRPAAQH